MAAAAGSNNYKNFQLKVEATVTTDAATATAAADMITNHRTFTLPFEPMLAENTALPHVRKAVEALNMPIPMVDDEDDVIVEKFVDSALRLSLALDHAADDEEAKKKLLSKEGLPLTTVRIYVSQDGYVTVIGDFESDDDEDTTDDDDADVADGVEATKKE